MKQITKTEEIQVVGGSASAYSIAATIRQPVCDLPLPASWEKKPKGGFVCVYPELDDPKLINVQNIDPNQLTTGFGG